MDSKKLLIFCIIIVICVGAISAYVITENNTIKKLNSYSKANNTTDKVNVASDSSSSSSSSDYSSSSQSSSSSNYDSDYDPERDDSHQYATQENPVTVQQSDGEYVYYGPGHYDYYAGDNHMSGEYYKYKNNG